jgi:hypothetical protein
LQVLENELCIEIDIDDTLLMTRYHIGLPSINIVCPYNGTIETRYVHELHVKILKEHKARGWHITVWSAAGWPWAKAAVEALKLEDYVDVVRTKPLKYMDDLEAKDILGQRLYLKPGL